MNVGSPGLPSKIVGMNNGVAGVPNTRPTVIPASLFCAACAFLISLHRYLGERPSRMYLLHFAGNNTAKVSISDKPHSKHILITFQSILDQSSSGSRSAS